jgi:PadR family transcriptional regulator, regulatory protein PadR
MYNILLVNTNRGFVMTVQDDSTQLKKGLLEMAVMKLIAGKPLYGYEIITQLEKVGMNVVQGTLYPLLTRLRKDELVTYSWQESTQGPPRKYYKLTPKGKTYLVSLAGEWQKLQSSLQLLFK